uniref:C2H2-type domain-containing protein n=1 Tax=Gongylonema pulchrum TaxID=637853 RepID=A0A183DHZ1_9BILA
LGRRRCKFHVVNRPGLRCTLCGIKSETFETIGQFHEHLLSCRKTPDPRKERKKRKLEKRDENLQDAKQ